jgi:hypothetical protein
MKSYMKIALVSLTMSLPAAAHLDQETLTLTPAGPYMPGATVTIEWVATQAHDGKYDLYFSPNGGTSWPSEFAEGWQGPRTNGAKVAYRWTIPANTANTTQARIRVCQLAGGHCTQPGTYTIMTPNFTISNTTALGDNPAQAEPSLEFRSAAHTVELVVPLQSDALVTLKAFDAAGKEVAELLSRRLDAGRHRLSFFSNRLAGRGPLLFRLTRGAETTTWYMPGEEAR